MKIAIDARFYGLENGGLGRYTINLIEQLQKLDKKNSYVLLLRGEWYKNLKLSDNFSKVLVNSRHYSIKEQFEVIKILRSINPDITHFLHFNVPFFYNGKYLVTIHDLLMHTGVGKEATTLSPIKYSIKRLGYRKVFDHAVKSASKVIVPTQFVKDDMLNTYSISSKKIFVIYEGVSELKKGEVTLPKTPYFLYVGNAYPHKNIKTLLKAIKHVSGNISLLLVTPRDAFTERLRKEIEDLGVSDRVILKGKVSDDELFSLYKNSLAFVYPSFSEGFGLQGLEAMSIGTRLLASDIPVFHEVYKDNATYFDPNDWEDLALRLGDTIQESLVERKSKLKTASQFVKRYSWQEMARDTLALYEGK